MTKGATVVRVLVAVCGSVLFTLLVGFLSVRAEAIELGLVLSWDNTPETIAAAHSPWLQRTAIGLFRIQSA